MNRSFFIFTFLLGFSFFLSGKSTYEQIAEENMKSFPSISEDTSHDFDSFSEYLAWSFKNQQDLKPFFKRRCVFTLFENYEKENPFQTSDILDFTTLQDLNLLCGPRSDNTFYVGEQINRTSTEFGKATLFGMLVNPVAHISELLNRQSIVKELINNTVLFSELDKAFNDLKDAENLLLSFWQNDTFESAAKRKEVRFPGKPNFVEELNKNALVAEINERLEQTREVMLCGCQAAGPLFLGAITYFHLTDNKEQAHILKKFGQKHLGVSTLTAFMSVWGISSWLLKTSVGANKWTKAINNSAVSVTYGSGLYYSYDSIKANAILLTSIQAKLMAVAHYVRALKNFEELFNSNPLLKEKLPAVRHIDQVLHTLPEKSKDFKKLLDQLSTDTFKGEPSLFSFAGRILSAYKIMQEQKDQLSGAFIALGEVDAYMSCARLYKEREGKPNAWCFAEFIEGAEEPSIDIDDFWNPLLDPNQAKANSISFGANGNPRTLVITGPNAGGKSTIMMKGVPLCLLCAQSFGIAPAQKMRFTPFTKIMTYLNITDDIAAGNSHFKAGVLRAQKMVDMSKALKKGEFAFIAVDEVFNGTTYLEGQAAAYSLIEFLGKHPQILCTTATHFPLITNLEAVTKGAFFKNYRVSVTYDEKGHIQYPFKIEPGISHQNVALDILREEGFENDFLARAHEILQTSAAA